MTKKQLIKFFMISFLLGLSMQVQARIDDVELEKIRTFIAQEQGPLLYNGIMARNQQVADPAERDDEKFRRSKKLLQNEMRHWNSRIQIITTWPGDQAVRSIADGFMEIVELGHFYHHYNSKTTTRAEAVRHLVSSESEGITNFIKGMDEFEKRFYGGAGDDLKNSYTSMKNIGIAYLKEVVVFIDNRSNKALLNLYNENRNAYLNRKESRYAGEYLEAVNEVIDFEQQTYINTADVSPHAAAKEIAAYSEKIYEVKKLLDRYLEEQVERGNKTHATKLQEGFDALLEDFENSKANFRNRYPEEAKRAKL